MATLFQVFKGKMRLILVICITLNLVQQVDDDHSQLEYVVGFLQWPFFFPKYI